MTSYTLSSLHPSKLSAIQQILPSAHACTVQYFGRNVGQEADGSPGRDGSPIASASIVQSTMASVYDFDGNAAGGEVEIMTIGKGLQQANLPKDSLIKLLKVCQDPRSAKRSNLRGSIKSALGRVGHSPRSSSFTTGTDYRQLTLDL